MGTRPINHTSDGSSSSHTMSSGVPPPSDAHYPPQWHHSHQWPASGPLRHNYPYTQPPPHHFLSVQLHPSPYCQQQTRYATPITESFAQAAPIYDLTQDDEPAGGKRTRDKSPAMNGWPNLGTDWSFLRQHILDMSEVLMQTMCPKSFGPHDPGRYHVILLLRQKSPECWQAGVTYDGRMVIEAPRRSCKQDAMMTLSEVIAARLGECIVREWESEDAQTGVEEGVDGVKFAIGVKNE